MTCAIPSDAIPFHSMLLIFKCSTQSTYRFKVWPQCSEKDGQRETHSVLCWFSPFPKPNNIFTIIQVGRTCSSHSKLNIAKCWMFLFILYNSKRMYFQNVFSAWISKHVHLKIELFPLDNSRKAFISTIW